MDRRIYTIGFLSILLNSCQQHATNSCENGEKDKDYETAIFTYLPGKDLTRVPLCEVKYYVNNGFLYSSERYHALYLVYSNDTTNKMSYQYSILFEPETKNDSCGWYKLSLKDVEIPRIPGTHLSGVILRNYYGDLVKSADHYGWPDAVLYNNCPQIANGRERSILTPELQKLSPYIK